MAKKLSTDEIRTIRAELDQIDAQLDERAARREKARQLVGELAELLDVTTVDFELSSSRRERRGPRDISQHVGALKRQLGAQ